MSREAKIRDFAGRFGDRLSPLLIEQALDYIQYNEEVLSFEILCEHIFEHTVSISMEECAMAKALAADMGIECNAIRRLCELVR